MKKIFKTRILFGLCILTAVLFTGCSGLVVIEETGFIGSSGEFGKLVAKRAMKYKGCPYKYGGTDKKGFDCSGLVYRVFSDLGVTLSRSAKDQVKEGREIPRGKERPGDLIFFLITSKTQPSHVGIVVSKGKMIHSPSSGKKIRISEYSGNPYWEPKIFKIIRIK